MKRFTLTAAAFLFVMASSSSAFAYDNRCAGFNDQLKKLGDVVEKACKANLPKGDVAKHRDNACKALKSSKAREASRIASEFDKEWRKVAGNSSLKIGPRKYNLGKGGKGTIQSTTQRMWISRQPASKNKVTFTLTELDGKMYVKAHVCVLKPGDRKPTYKKSITFNKDKKAKKKKGERKSVTVSGTKGNIVFFKISAQKANALKFKYKFTSRER